MAKVVKNGRKSKVLVGRVLRKNLNQNTASGKNKQKRRDTVLSEVSDELQDITQPRTSDALPRSRSEESGLSNLSARSDQDHEYRMTQLQLDRERLELERERIQADLEIARIQSGSSRTNSGDNMVERDPIIKFGDLFKRTAPKIPANNEDLPVYFITIEKLFDTLKIPNEIKGTLLLPHLGNRMQHLVTQLSPEELNSYDTLKEELLKTARLTPGEYRRNFLKARKSEDESYMQYCSRLKGLWSYYERSRNVKSLADLQDLIVADKLRDSLTDEMQKYIVLQEGTGGFMADKIACLAQTVKEADFGKRKQGIASSSSSSGWNRTEFTRHEGTNGTKDKVLNRDYQNGVNQKPMYNQKRSFYNSNLWKRSSRNDSQNGQRKPMDNGKACFICGDKAHLAKDCKRRVHSNTASSKVQSLTETSEEDSNAITARMSVTSEVCKIGGKLERISLDVEGQQILALVDSGADITVISSRLVPPHLIKPCGKIKLLPALGGSVLADLVKLKIGLSEKEDNLEPCRIEMLCAVVEDLNEAMLINPKDLEDIKKQESHFLHSILCREHLPIDQNGTRLEDKGGTELENELSSSEAILNMESDLIEDDNGEEALDECRPTVLEAEAELVINSLDPEDVSEVSAREKFKNQQLSDTTLKDALKNAKERKMGYEFRDELLYHRDKIVGQDILQLVLPLERRKEVLELAHSSLFGAHLAGKKTCQRIKLSFYWPGIDADVKKFCQSCVNCQLRRPATIRDKVPITPIQRPDYPFMVVNVDIIGPIDPPAHNYKYILCMIDLHSRWPEAVPLSTITAKATCEALLTIFMRTGVPKVIISDRGTNFTSQLTQVFLKRIGVTPRFTSPGHPEASGTCERWNGVLKKMLHHVIREYPKQWNQYLPYLLWAYREVPNASTGIAPYTLVYGKEPTGPLSILKDHWSGELPEPMSLAKPLHTYLSQLKKRLEVATEQAGLKSEVIQQAYTHRYNMRARPKSFEAGEQVILLIPDSSNKLWARWTGPATVIEKRSPSSYTVELSDGSRRHVHVNKIRKFITRANTIGVIFDEDEDFGEINTAPIQKDRITNLENSSYPVSKKTSENLTDEQLSQLNEMLHKEKSFFSGKLGRVKSVKHHIHLKPDFQRKRVPLYKIPETLRTEVNRQIEELLKEGAIERADVDIVHPVVCVAKKDGSIRLCVDFRALNMGTIDDAFPMKEPTELLQKVARARYISAIDIYRGYWQIEMSPESKPLTAFATPNGTYVWNVLPFGLKTASATFQRAINTALEQHSEYATAYIDDVAIFSSSWEEHLEHLKRVIRTLKDFGFTGNLEKSQFGKMQVNFLGHVIGQGKILPDPQKLEAIKALEKPTTKKKLRGVLGLFGYYREHIEGFSDLAFSLTELTSKKIPSKIPWERIHEEAFEKLKQRLVEAPALYAPDYSRGFIIDCDASGIGIGACLSQIDSEGKERPIAFASKKFSASQRNWTTIEREAYAVLYSLKKFEHYLYNIPVTVRSDHNPLSYLCKTYPQGPKLQRWALALQRFNVVIQHRSGKMNVNADSLSRLFK